MELFETRASDGLILSSYKFIPKKIDSVILILHGSIEHAKRYFEIANFLCENNVAVYTFDQRGHGMTAKKEEDVAYFSDNDEGWYQTIADVDLFVDMIKENHPDKSITLFGHSMGSFLARTYIAKYPKKVQKSILSGTADVEKGLLSLGRMLCNVTVKMRGRRYRSKIIHNLLYGTLNNRIKNPRTDFDFITNDEKIVDEYINDDRCGNLVTCEYGREMLNGIKYITDPVTYELVDKDLPIFIIAGQQDPLAGKDHSDLNRTIEGYKNAKIKNLKVKIYEGMRHEIINEVEKQTVYDDILAFIG
jgi:alpha-beta hydrolase superfamily lysophospholipase